MAHYLPEWWSDTVLWIAFGSYVSVVAIYIIRFMFDDISIRYDNLVIFGLLIIGFTFLSTSIYIKTRTKRKDIEVFETTQYLFHPYARIGWALVGLHFISLYVFRHHTAFYYPIAILAYTLLALKSKIGIPALLLFYVCSVLFHFPHHPVDFFVFLTKIGISLYIGTYFVVFVRQHYTQKEKLHSK